MPTAHPVSNLDPACVVTRASKEQESITDTLVWESTDEETSQEDVSERPESPRPAKKKATKQKSQGAGNDHEVESKKLSRRKSTEKGTYTENMSRRKKERLLRHILSPLHNLSPATKCAPLTAHFVAPCTHCRPKTTKCVGVHGTFCRP